MFIACNAESNYAQTVGRETNALPVEDRHHLPRYRLYGDACARKDTRPKSHRKMDRRILSLHTGGVRGSLRHSDKENLPSQDLTLNGPSVGTNVQLF